ncbi:MAG: alpha/beta fold hydrolase [Chelatococcus sp.]|uniref:alpha/beta fold hydrolase n=1 Tax=Chelatococcus sp. TaxID=1953771 RepID=UPI0025B849A2|nr:alpha/beta fold hydrolase [Chelatococcus sp.]MBX3540028.1 alpha/beta fold hydrolase [Chelatococcus sp.]
MRYRFGSFELTTDTRELLAGGRPIDAEPQVFDLLLHLMRERDRVVSLDELLEVVWKGRLVSNSAINARVSAARSVIGDDGKRQEWIRTIPRRGFRFVGAVETISPALPDEPSKKPAPMQAYQRVAFCRSADGTRIAYATSGNGYRLVKAGHWLTHLEHDWHSPIWRPFLDRLSQRFQVTRYDQRGNGLSEWDIGDFSLDRFVEDLEAVVSAAHLERFALFGSSQGVPIAIAYACRHPHKVSHLVLQGGYEKGRLVRAESDKQQGEALLTLMRHGWGKSNSPFLDAFATMFIPDGSREQVASLADLQRQTASPENAASIRLAVDHFDVSHLLERLSVPTLVAHSRDDGIQPLEQGYRLATRIRQAEFLMLESRNHVILPEEKAWGALFEGIERFVLEADLP